MCLKAADAAERDTWELKEFRKFQRVHSDKQHAKVYIWHKEAMLEAKTRLHDQRRAALQGAACSKERPKGATAKVKYDLDSPPKPQAAEPASKPPPGRKHKAVGALDNGVSAPSSGLMRFLGSKTM